MSDEQLKTGKGWGEERGRSARTRGQRDQGGQEAREEAGAEDRGRLESRKISLKKI